MSDLFNLEAVDAAVAGKVEAATLPVCSVEGCEQYVAGKASDLCRAHLAADKVERFKGYAATVKEAATLANRVEGEAVQGITLHIRITNARAGFAYFLKEAMPRKAVKLDGYTGMSIRMEGASFEAATVFAASLNASETADKEAFEAHIVAVPTV